MIGTLIGYWLHMRISVEKSSTLERRLTVEIPEERIASELQERLDKLSKNVRIPGFRPGKAPPKVVRQQFATRVRNEIVGEILQSSFSEAMSQKELRAAGQPVLDPVTTAPGDGLSYTATFEVFPHIELTAPEQLELEQKTCEILEADIDLMAEKLRDQNKEWVAVERPAADGDQLAIDFVGSIDGTVFDGGTGTDFNLQFGSGMMIDGFEEGLRGASAGDEVTLDLQFPPEYRNTALAGKPARFEVTVNKVSEKLLPSLDETFFEKFGVKDGGLPAFRAEVRQNMEKERDRALRQQLTAEVMEKISAANVFEVPSALVINESQRLRQQMANEMLMRGLNPSALGAEFEGAVRERAINRVKLGLLMAEIIKVAALRADPTKIRQKLEGMASSYEDPAAVMKWYYENPQQLQQIEGMCLEDEAVNWIVGRAKVTATAIAFDALMNPVQTGNKAEASS